MKEPAYDDGWGKLYIGTALDVLRQMPAQSVHMAVTSPPYFGLRSYLSPEHPDKGQEIGTEKTPQEFVAKLVEVFGEVWRVLRDDGQLWVNIGDSYTTKPNNNAYHGKGPDTSRLTNPERQLAARNPTKYDTLPPGLKPKDLCMVPARLAIALQDAGWYLRQEIVWDKPASMPESVKDRCTRSHEMVYMLTKRPRYFYDNEAIKEAVDAEYLRKRWGGTLERTGENGLSTPQRSVGNGKAQNLGVSPSGRNARSVWRINPRPFSGSHFAVFPPDLPMRCIKAGTSERGVCSRCGAPWRRVVERKAMVIKRSDWGEQAGNRTASSGTMIEPPESRTVGWEPTCSCNGTFIEEPYEVFVTNRETGEDEPFTRYRQVYTPAIPLSEHPTEPATVLDPFAGSGTTLMAAAGLSRRSIGIDLDAKSAILTAERMGQPWLAPKEEGEPVALEEGRLF